MLKFDLDFPYKGNASCNMLSTTDFTDQPENLLLTGRLVREMWGATFLL